MAQDYLFDTEGFEVFYPGRWTEREKPCFEEYLAKGSEINSRTSLDLDQVIHGDPGSVPGYITRLEVTEDLIRYFADLYAPANPLFHDGDYCRSALGMQDIMAYPSIACCDDVFQLTVGPQARDLMYVCDFHMSNSFHLPIHPGDTLFYVQDSHHMLDLTPEEGSVYRTLGLRSTGRVFNQKGQAVSSVSLNVHENYKTFKDGMPQGIRPWLEVKKPPVHVYTDEDYERFCEIWRNEKPRGDAPLYWEDVKVGDQPNPTLDGPIVYGTHPCMDRTKGYGMGWGGHRPLKEEILDPAQRKTLLRHPDYGFYYKQYPSEKGDGFEALSPNGMNFTKRDFAISHLYNWMGYHGTVRNIQWTVLPGFTPRTPFFPRDPGEPLYLKDVPVVDTDTITGFTQAHDIILVRSYVLEKTVVDGEHRVKLAWWVTGIDGDITFAGEATVALPSRFDDPR